MMEHDHSDHPAEATPPPGADAANPVDVDADPPPVYEQGAVPGAPLDLAQGEPDPICFICKEVTHEDGGHCNQIQPCCRAACHRACYRPWLEMQQAQYGSVSCPACRTIVLC